MRLCNFTELDERALRQIWQWRTDPRVGKFMRRPSFGWEEHLAFVEGLRGDAGRLYFAVLAPTAAATPDTAEEIIGVIDFINIAADSCEFGLYARPGARGLGQALMDEVKRYAFEILGVKILRAWVFKHNQKALSLYLANGLVPVAEEGGMVLMTTERG